MYNQFRPPLFPNNFANTGAPNNFNGGFGMKHGMQSGPYGVQSGPYGMMPMYGGNMSPMSNQVPQSNPVEGSSPMNQTMSRDIAGGSPSNTMLDEITRSRRVQHQVQHHVQQVPVFRTIQVQERIVEIPQIHIVKEYVPKIEIVERVREVPKIEIQIVEKIVEVPQVQYVDKYVDKIEVREVERFVPKIEVVEVVREVPKMEYQVVEKIVEVPQIQYVDKVVEVTQIKEVVRHVPKIEIVEVPVRRENRVPKLEIRQIEKIQEVFVPEIVEVVVEKEVRVNVPVPRVQRVERPVPGPLNIVDVEVEVKVPKQVQVPHYIDVPVPREVIKEIPVPRQVFRYRDVEVKVEVEHIVTERIERRVPVPRTVYKHVEEIKRIEVPYEVTVPEEVEEIVEVVSQIQPVIEPVVHTRYERLPPIHQQGKAVYMNGPPRADSPATRVGLPPPGPSFHTNLSNQTTPPSPLLKSPQTTPLSPQLQNLGTPPSPQYTSFQNQATPMMGPVQLPFAAPYAGVSPVGAPFSGPYKSAGASPVGAPFSGFPPPSAFDGSMPSHPFQRLAFTNPRTAQSPVQLPVPLAATAITLPAAVYPTELSSPAVNVNPVAQNEAVLDEKCAEAAGDSPVAQNHSVESVDETHADSKEVDVDTEVHTDVQTDANTNAHTEVHTEAKIADGISREETCEIAPIAMVAAPEDASFDSNLADKTIAGEDAPNEPLATWEPQLST